MRAGDRTHRKGNNSIMPYQPNYWITSASFTSGTLVLYVNGSPKVDNMRSYAFVFAPNIPVPTGTEANTLVVLSIDGTEYPLWDKFGMKMTFSEIPTSGSPTATYFAPRKAIVCGIGSTASAKSLQYHFSAWNLPYPSAYIVPIKQA